MSHSFITDKDIAIEHAYETVLSEEFRRIYLKEKRKRKLRANRIKFIKRWRFLCCVG